MDLSGGRNGDLRIAALSDRTQVSITTIRFYLRSGLLHAGRRTGRNQMLYDESHVRRLRVIRTLIDQGGLSASAVAKVVGAASGRTVAWILARISRAPSTVDLCANEMRMKWRHRLDAVLDGNGWHVAHDSAAGLEMVDVLVGMEQAGHAPDDALLAAYLRAGATVAAAESAYLKGVGESKEGGERLVVSAVLGAVVLAAARRLFFDVAGVTRPRDC